MRLKSYIAPSMAEAMYLVRQELGDGAIIVSTQRAAGGKGVRITAALERDEIDDALGEMLAEVARTPAAEILRDHLTEHGVPARIVERLVNAAQTSGISEPQQACAYALESGFAFAPLPDHGAPRPFILVGPPGTGKSMAVAKLAARSALRNRKVGVITTDNIRAGATEQLSAFTRILEIDLIPARGPETLRRAVEQSDGRFDIVFIDSPGLNPFKQTDMDYLAALTEAGNCEPILVMAAGGDPVEAGEISEGFSQAGTTRLLATRLDTTRRLGAVIAAAEAGPMMFCDISATPHVVNGIAPVTAAVLAKMIIPDEVSEDTEQPSPSLPLYEDPSEFNPWIEASE